MTPRTQSPIGGPVCVSAATSSGQSREQGWHSPRTRVAGEESEGQSEAVPQGHTVTVPSLGHCFSSGSCCSEARGLPGDSVEPVLTPSLVSGLGWVFLSEGRAGPGLLAPCGDVGDRPPDALD